MNRITVEAIPAFDDNYLWLIENDDECWVVDPGDGAAVKEVLTRKNRQLTGILVTHHHADHVGGISTLKAVNMPIIGPSLSPYPLVNDPVADNDRRTICGIEFHVFSVPGHTLNHLAYYADMPQGPVLFCGDTLFAGGCGRLFEGTPDQMNQSLQKLAQLPPETLVYCAHEYTLANLKFALTLEPDNPNLIERHKTVSEDRKKGLRTIPSSIDIELKTNPFLRTGSAQIISSAKAFSPDTASNSNSVFSTIRKMKDQF